MSLYHSVSCFVVNLLVVCECFYVISRGKGRTERGSVCILCSIEKQRAETRGRCVWERGRESAGVEIKKEDSETQDRQRDIVPFPFALPFVAHFRSPFLPPSLLPLLLLDYQLWFENWSIAASFHFISSHRLLPLCIVWLTASVPPLPRFLSNSPFLVFFLCLQSSSFDLRQLSVITPYSLLPTFHFSLPIPSHPASQRFIPTGILSSSQQSIYSFDLSLPLPMSVWFLHIPNSPSSSP